MMSCFNFFPPPSPWGALSPSYIFSPLKKIVFETGFQEVAEASLEFVILLPQPPDYKCNFRWDYKCVSPHASLAIPI